jgi:predicted glycoside hydrolase/deacetylase ChbG (UPF0249 family)
MHGSPVDRAFDSFRLHIYSLLSKRRLFSPVYRSLTEADAALCAARAHPSFVDAFIPGISPMA